MPWSRCSSFAAALARLDRKKSLVIGLPRKPLTVRREIVKTAQPVDDSTDRVHALGRPRRLAFIHVYSPSRRNQADANPCHTQTLAGGKVAHLFQDHLLKFCGCLFLSHRRAQSLRASSGQWSHVTGTFVASVRSRRDGGLCGLDTPLPALGQKFPECPVCPVLGHTRRLAAFVGVSAKFFHRVHRPMLHCVYPWQKVTAGAVCRFPELRGSAVPAPYFHMDPEAAVRPPIETASYQCPV